MYLSDLLIGLMAPLILLVVLFLALARIASWYKRVPPNKFMIVFGKGQRGAGGGEIVTNGGRIVWPIINEAAFMEFKLYNLPVRVERVPTKNLVPLTVDAVVQVRIKNEESAMRAAANLFLGREGEISGTVTQVLEGKLREILATMDIEEVNQNRELFASQVQEVAVQALAPMGLGIVNFSIREIVDHDNYLLNLAAKRVAEVNRDAQIAQAEAAKEAAVKSAEAEQEAEIAKARAQTQIAEAQKERDLKTAAFKRETEVARADAEIAYAQRQAVLKQDLAREQKKVELVETEANIQIAAKKAEAQERHLDAEVRKPAEAKRYQTEQEAEAAKYATIVRAQAEKEQEIARAEAQAVAMERKGKAEAEAVRATQMAEADVQKAKMLAEAEGVRAKLLAEAEGIKAKGLAEAEALRMAGLAKAEALEKEAEALAKMNEAGKLQMVVNVLPEVARALAEPLSRVERIVLINGSGADGKGGVGIGALFSEVSRMLPQLQETLKATTGVDLLGTLEQNLKVVRESEGSATTEGPAAADGTARHTALPAPEPASPAPDATGNAPAG